MRSATRKIRPEANNCAFAEKSPLVIRLWPKFRLHARYEFSPVRPYHQTLLELQCKRTLLLTMERWRCRRKFAKGSLFVSQEAIFVQASSFFPQLRHSMPDMLHC